MSSEARSEAASTDEAKAITGLRFVEYTRAVLGPELVADRMQQPQARAERPAKHVEGFRTVFDTGGVLTPELIVDS